MKRITFFRNGWLLLFSLLLAFGCGAPRQGEEEWVQLFNGRDLEGWTPKIRGYVTGENFANTFRVEDGLLKVRYDGYDSFDDRFGHLFYKDTFSHYILRVEYRFVGEQCPGGAEWALRNSGAMIHGQPLETMELNQDFPTSVEVQFLGGDGEEERPTCNLCTPGTNVVMNGELILDHCISSSSPTFHGEEWVTAEVEVHGSGTIIHRVNGETVITYEQPQLDERDATYSKLIPANGDKLLYGGTISVQSESHPIDFRKIELKKLN